MVHAELVAAVRLALEGHADPAKAGAMQAYMKSAMPYRGVQATPQRRLYAAIFRDHPLRDAASWRATALALWREAAFREERYAAIALTGVRDYRAWQTLDTIPMYEEMIATGAWWDYVDALAIHRVGPLLQAFPRQVSALMKRWSRDADMWKRRTSILAQIALKTHTDVALLRACIEPNLADREFFIRKAIGWALRQHARVDPDEVRRFVRAHEGGMSALSRREAVKHLR